MKPLPPVLPPGTGANTMMHMPEQHAEIYRGHAIRISAAVAPDAPHRFEPRIEWVEQVNAPQHIFYKVAADASSFADPLTAIAHGVKLVRHCVDRMLAQPPGKSLEAAG
jgi:hypothetical protein